METHGHDERLDLLDALIYADVFGCAVTFDELWRYSRTPVDREALRQRLRNDPTLLRIVVERDGFYCLADRPGLLDQRSKRIDQAQRLHRRALRVARVLRHVPFIRGLALTGSAAADNAAEDADTDLLVVVAPARLGIAFLLLGPASRLLGRRVFCPNYYVCEDRLGLVPSNLYVARELAQARTLVGKSQVFRDANPWLAEVFPNAATPPRSNGDLRACGRLQLLLELPLRGRIGDRLEGWTRQLVATRLRAHYGGLGQDVPADVMANFAVGAALRFHGGRVDETTLERHASRRARVAELLTEVDRELEGAT